MNRLHVLLVQLPVPNNAATNVPLAAGYLKTYAQSQGLLDHCDIEILPRALADSAGDALLVDAIVARAPQVLGVSLYTWNSERSLDVVQRVKQRLPQLVAVVGGPEVQTDNTWLLEHSAVDVAVVGEGEQTFAALLRLAIETHAHNPAGRLLPHHLLAAVPGVVFRDATGTQITPPERVPLAELGGLPSPYLEGYIEPSPMLMVEVSRWCPYSCSFCLYGRNMGAKLGNRYFGTERLLEEIRWGREHGATQVHFIEANLNLVPVFRGLMSALADSNADGHLALYAELRGEHLHAENVGALAQAGLRVAEVGLQTANPVALKASHRRTDLRKWAAGTRQLYQHGVEVLLDVILGLPEDDAAGVAQTLAFIEEEALGAYDIFTLQVLPGTAVRRESAIYGMRFQERPPYYVLETDRLSYRDMRRLRRELKQRIDLDPDAVEGCPPPRLDALADAAQPDVEPVRRWWLAEGGAATWRGAAAQTRRLAAHVDVVAQWHDHQELGALLARAIAANPSTLFDVYFVGEPPTPVELARWRDELPWQPGYLDRVAVYRRADPATPYDRVSPRVWLAVPWVAQAEPADYAGIAEIVWEYPLAAGEEPPLGAWRSAGGAGVWARGASSAQTAVWREQLAVWE